jgi:hypothetical protein
MPQIRIAPNPQGTLPRPVYADPQDFGAGSALALQRAGASVTTEAADVLSDMLRARRLIADQGEKLDIATALEGVKVGLAKYKSDLLTAEGGPDPEAWQQSVSQYAEGLVTQAAGTMKTREAGMKLRVTAMPWLSEQSVHAIGEADKMKRDKTDFQARTLMTSKIEQAGTAPTQEAYEQAVGEGIIIAKSMNQSTVWSGATAASELDRLTKGAATGRALKLYQDPATRPALIGALLEGKFQPNTISGMQFPGMPPAEQFQLGMSLQNRAAAEEKKQQDDLERAHTAARKNAETVDTLAILNKEPGAWERVQQHAIEFGYEHGFVTAMNSEWSKPEKEAPSDKSTLLKYQAFVGEWPPRKGFGVPTIMAEDGLNSTDKGHLVRAMSERDKQWSDFTLRRSDHNVALASQNYARWRSAWRSSFGVGDILPDNIDPTRREAIAHADIEYARLANPLGGGMDPEKAAGVVLQRYLPWLNQQYNLSEEQLVGSVKTDAKGLDFARKNGGRLPNGGYLSPAEMPGQEALIRELKRVQDEKQFLKDQQDAAALRAKEPKPGLFENLKNRIPFLGGGGGGSSAAPSTPAPGGKPGLNPRTGGIPGVYTPPQK